MNYSLRDEITDKDLIPADHHEIADVNTRSFSDTQESTQQPLIKPEKGAGSSPLAPDKKSTKSHASHPSITSEAALDNSNQAEGADSSKISAYARLDFDNFTFFVQTLQIVLGRKSNDELINGSQHSVDVHLSSKKAISRRHAKIFYNFGTQRFELSILGRNGAFVDDLFIEKGMTIPLVDGTKIQVGDITFQFVLPSIEGNEAKDTRGGAKPFNPSDAISLRSSLYSNSTSPSKTAKSTPEPNRRKSVNRRRGSKPTIPRRLSESRRKSLATATTEEIDTILHELGVKTLDEIEDIDENDPSFVDEQIRIILGTGPTHNESAIVDDEDDELLFGDSPGNKNKNNRHEDSLLDNHAFESFNEGEEDELDKLVKQHNLEQGVDLDESSLDRDELSVIDEEIVNLAPLIAHNEGNKDKQKFNATGNGNQYNMNNANRTGPLMGRPAPPRMGKPASIQPTSARLYGRSIPSAGAKNSAIDSRLQAITTPINGLPTHLVAQGHNDYPLKLAQGNLGGLGYNQSNNQFAYNNKPYIPARPSVPELLVPIQTIQQKPVEQPEIIIDKITVTTTFTHPPVYIPSVIGKPGMVPKIPKRRKEPSAAKKPAKHVYPMNEIPEHYRTKPALPFPVMIVNVLKAKNDSKGLSINEITENIKEAYPYYKYCPDGWQSIVSHNVRLNKLFKAVGQDTEKEPAEGTSHEDKWIIDDSFVQEKEKVKKKQQEIAAQRAKEAALRAEELKQKQRMDLQQSISQNIVGRDFSSPYGLPLNASHPHLLSQSQLLAQLHHKNPGTLYQATSGANGQKPKTIAEIASEIRRDGTQSSKTPMYFKPQVVPGAGGSGASSGSDSRQGSPQSISPSNIKAQLAANRSQYPPAAGANASPASQNPAINSSRPQSPSMNSDTKKSLTYLQKELFTLYKARKLSYNTATTTEIITKALATTIAQVNAIGSKAGVGDNALSFLVERAPQQVSKILDIALTKSIKEKQGVLSSRPNSRGTTPGPSQIPSPKRQSENTAKSSVAGGSSIVKEANRIGTERLQDKEAQKDSSSSVGPSPRKEDKPDTAISSLGKPPSFKSGTSSKQESPVPLTRPSPGLSAANSGASAASVLTRPQGFGKPPGALSKPPQFVSNKPPTRPGYGAKPDRKEEKPDDKNDNNKRPHAASEDIANKTIKLE